MNYTLGDLDSIHLH